MEIDLSRVKNWQDAGYAISDAVDRAMAEELRDFDKEKLAPVLSKLTLLMNAREQIKFTWMQRQIEAVAKLPEKWIEEIYNEEGELDFFVDSFGTSDQDPRDMKKPQQYDTWSLLRNDQAIEALQQLGWKIKEHKL